LRARALRNPSEAASVFDGCPRAHGRRSMQPPSLARRMQRCHLARARNLDVGHRVAVVRGEQQVVRGSASCLPREYPARLRWPLSLDGECAGSPCFDVSRRQMMSLEFAALALERACDGGAEHDVPTVGGAPVRRLLYSAAAGALEVALEPLDPMPRGIRRRPPARARARRRRVQPELAREALDAAQPLEVGIPR
jgi:hypothetical protein